VGAEFDALDLGGPELWKEDVVDVVGAIFVVAEIIGRSVSWPWDSEQLGKDSTQRSTEAQRTRRRAEKDKRDFSLRRPTRSQEQT